MTMRRVIVFAILVSCARHVPEPHVSPDSPLAQLRVGMSQAEVKSILGDPTDSHGNATAKVAIPFYMGNDVAEVTWHYKNTGRVIFALGVFNQNPALIRVEEDRQESGFYRQRR